MEDRTQLSPGNTTDGSTGSFTGRLVRTRIRDYQSGFAIFDLREKTNTIVCKGYMLPVPNNTLLKVDGKWHTDPKWGLQLIDCTVTELRTDFDSMREYLRGIPGIGAKIAELIISVFGETLYDEMGSPGAVEKLTGIRQVTHDMAVKIVSYIRNTEQQRQLWELLSRHGVSSFSAVLKIYKKYGDKALKTFKDDPYAVGMRAGLTFAACDAIAASENMPASGTARITAAVRAALKNAASNGHSYLPYSDLAKYTKKKLKSREGVYNTDISAPAIDMMLSTMYGSYLTRENDFVYLSTIRKAEAETAFMVRELVRKGIRNECDPEELCAFAEQVYNVEYADKQRDAFKLLQHGGLSVITGGPGTGKTTVIKGLIAAYVKLYPKKVIKLCAPTGRASQRMKEVTGRETTTIHRLLEFRPYNGELAHKDRDDPIDADLLIVDEGSMLSIELAELLFSAIKPGTMVIICGDIDQLPAVGAGNVLHDLIYCEKVPVVALTKTHRQAEGSLIIENAGKMRDGLTNLKSGVDFEIVPADDTDMPEIVKKYFLKHHNPDDVFACQVLSPARKRMMGSVTNSNYLNDVIQAAVNPTGASVKFGESTFRVGDKIMMMRNNYEAGYYNGDVGVIVGVSEKSVSVKIENEILEIEQDLFDDVSLAYATTIHKSQGSEYNTAIIVLPSQPIHMLQRNLLYTAITRAKKKVILIAAPNSINMAIHRKDASKRNSKLIGRIRGEEPLSVSNGKEAENG